MEGKRSERVADLVQREVSEMLLKTVKDPRIGFVTITKVTVSDDCRLAKVYFSVMGTPAERERSMEGLTHAKGYVRKELGRRLKLRYVPDVQFQFDPSIEYGIQLEEMIHQLHEKGEKESDEDGWSPRR
jgi:ribosome-binding factor A